MNFSQDSIKIDPALKTEKIVSRLRTELIQKLHKKGAVIGISGGLDSSVVLALCVRALSSDKILALMIPEKDSSSDSLKLDQILAEIFNVKYVVEEISDSLTALGFYRRRDNAVKKVFPEYNESYIMKITIPKNNTSKGLINFFNLSIITPTGEEKIKRLPISEYLEIVVASNLKQRGRINMIYYHAEENNYCVVGTGNKNEYKLGFFVKNSDGRVDIMPIGHLFKSQVYQLAEYLGIPDEILKRTPTTDTHSAEQTQEESFFKVLFKILDPDWLGMEMEVWAEVIDETHDIDTAYVNNVIPDIKSKTRTTEHLRYSPIFF